MLSWWCGRVRRATRRRRIDRLYHRRHVWRHRRRTWKRFARNTRQSDRILPDADISWKLSLQSANIVDDVPTIPFGDPVERRHDRAAVADLAEVVAVALRSGHCIAEVWRAVEFRNGSIAKTAFAMTD